MSRERPGNVAASVRQRPLNLARERSEDFQIVLMRYALERLLYRLSRSPHRDGFVLKGAMAFSLWVKAPYRVTKDLDLLGIGDGSAERLAGVFRDLCEAEVDNDGLRFDAGSVAVDEIRETQEYGGLRVTLTAHLGKARIPMQVDVGFGDVVTPAPVEVDLPVLLDMPHPRVRAYPPETVIAEKVMAMVALGMANSRMKDFFDVWMLAREHRFEGVILCQAIAATFERRKTALPKGTPLALTEEFAEDPGKNTQWEAFAKRGRLTVDAGGLAEVVAGLREFLMPPLAALAKSKPFSCEWEPSGPWLRSGG